MQITKINTIRNVGRFKNCGPSNNDTFSKFTFIYADNGSGKTTFCNILRSLKTGDATYLQGRKTLGTDDDIFASLEIDGRNINFSNNAWSETLPDIEIFDDTYIFENVYATDGISHDHKKNLYQVIIGNEGVQQAREYERLDSEARAVNDQCRQQETLITRGLPSTIQFRELANLSCPEDVDEKIADAEKEIAAIKESENLKRHASVETLSLPTIPDGIEETLSETITGVAKDVSDKVTEHITTHQMQNGGEQWLSTGLRYKTENCPFCEQDLKNSTFAPVLEGFFSDGYNELKRKVSQMNTALTTALGERVISQLRLTVTANTSNIEFWSQYCKISLPEFDIDNAESTLVNLKDELLRLIEVKAQSVLEPVGYDTALNSAMSAFSELVEQVSIYNEHVESVNSTVAAKKQSLGTADLNAAQANLDKLVTAKELHQGELKNQFAEYNAIATEWQRLDKAKKEAKTALDTYTETVMQTYETSINKVLEAFNAGFRIANTTHDYRGAGTPRTTFQIEINGVAINPGDGTTPLDQPSLKNTLSAGDKSALAFAFFWAQLQSKGDLSNTVIVLDDPFSSQDGVRRTATAYKATRSAEATNAAQMILLSHDDDFLRDARQYLTEANRALCTVFGILGDPNNYSIINPYSLDSEAQDQYIQDKEKVQLYLGENEGSELDVVRTLRPLLEGYYKTRFPALVAANHTLGDITSNIRSVGETHPLHNVVEQLEEINLYTRPYHHGNNAGQQPAAINSNELRGSAMKVLSIIGAS